MDVIAALRGVGGSGTIETVVMETGLDKDNIDQTLRRLRTKQRVVQLAADCAAYEYTTWMLVSA